MTKGAQSLLLLVVAGAVMIGLTLWRMGLVTFPRPQVPAVEWAGAECSRSSCESSRVLPKS